MGKRAEVKTEMTAEMLYERYRRAKDPVERTHWHMLWQVKEGKSPQEAARVFGYTAGWVRKMIRRWNAAGEAGIIVVTRPGSQTEASRRAATRVGSSLAAAASRWRVVERPESGSLDAGETGPRDRPTARLGLLTTAGLEHTCTSSTACESGRGNATHF